MFKDFNRQLNYCTFCPKMCRFACPVTLAEARETVTPTLKLQYMRLLRDGAIPFTDDVADIFYRCAGCLNCRAFCKHRIDVPEVIEEARRLAVNRGLAPASLDRYLSTLAVSGNPYGDRLRAKLDALGLAARHGRKSDTVFFIGCTGLYHFGDVARDTAALLETAGVDFAVHASGSLCCGTPALLSGARAELLRTARENAEALKPYKRIISGCPSCLATMKFKYESLGIHIRAEFISMAQFMAQRMRDKKLPTLNWGDERVMYHDPCHLGKFFGIFDEPRYLLSQLYKPENILEFSWNRDKNACCGGGGLLPITVPKTSKSITERRLEEFREQSPDILISACPTCERTFHRQDPRIRVRNLIGLLAERVLNQP